MQGTHRDRLISWMLGAIAGISIGMSVLDVIGIAPGWAAKLTPFFVGVLLLYVVLERERVDSVKFIVRRIDRGMDKLNREVRQMKVRRGKDDPSGGIIENELTWKGMTFRSKTELRVARALDQAEVFFLPPVKARLTIGKDRHSREIDFLVFANGRWGMLEVDGPWHNAANDQARDEKMRQNGIHTIQRFSSDRCYHHPTEVVSEFLAMLEAQPSIMTAPYQPE
jgi:hypothetical protein